MIYFRFLVDCYFTHNIKYNYHIHIEFIEKHFTVAPMSNKGGKSGEFFSWQEVQAALYGQVRVNTGELLMDKARKGRGCAVSVKYKTAEVGDNSIYLSGSV